MLEVNIGIICSCLLAFPAFIKHYWPEHFGGSLTSLLRSTFRSRGRKIATTETSYNASPYSQWEIADGSEGTPLAYVKLSGGHYVSRIDGGVSDEAHNYHKTNLTIPDRENRSLNEAI